jgi:O-acetylhomoserine/O-acetylserine sulfhydrylase-like pyridoxal-dependent enzyme
VDSTLSSSLGQQSILIVHPLLSDVLACKLLVEQIIDIVFVDNLEAWLLLRSMRTFSLRVQRQCQTASIILQSLEKQRIHGNKMMKVHHPSLESHLSCSLTSRYLRLPPATFSFELESESQFASLASIVAPVCIVEMCMRCGSGRFFTKSPR